MFLTRILIGVYYKFKISLTRAQQMFIFVWFDSWGKEVWTLEVLIGDIRKYQLSHNTVSQKMSI